MRFLVLRQIDRRQRRGAAEQRVGERERRLGLADAGRPGEQEYAERRVFAFQASLGGAQTLSQGADRIVLSDHACGERRLEREQAPQFVLDEIADRYARPFGDHARDGLRIDVGGDHRRLSPSARERVDRIDHVSRIRRGVGRTTKRAHCIDEFALPCVLAEQRVGGIAHRVVLRIDRVTALRDAGDAGAGVSIERRAFQFERRQRGMRLLQFRRQYVECHPHARGCRIDQIHGLVRQLARRNVAARQAHGRDDRLVADVNIVMGRIAAGEPAQHQAGGFVVRLVDLDDLEAPFERGIAFEVLLVFGPRGGRDRAQLAACERRLEQVGGIGAACRVTRTDQRVRLVDEQQDRGRRSSHLVDHVLQPLLEFALYTGAGLQQAEIECQDARVADRFRNAAVDHAQCEPFDKRGFADARLADQDRIVLAAAREHVDHLPDFAVASEDGVDLAAARLFGDVEGEARECVVLDRARGGRLRRGGRRRRSSYGQIAGRGGFACRYGFVDCVFARAPPEPG
ncbi:63 kDa protein [Burkholderia ambifaria IOP40-10]|uniref:63 kDa protein n=1 Tax=Burkholderia ambifaria IOP40-10 TaxID=396596 RepID=B1FAK6_9BURK|nr:63 kDa protein [Burkholderia ambifaria IOP40-10]